MSSTEKGRDPASTDRRFPKESRLKNASQFRAVYSGGRKKISRSFVVFILPNQSETTRFGLTTPRKVGKAHERNRIRRRVREILRHGRGALASGYDVVINPRRTVLDRDFASIDAELRSLLGTMS